MLENMFSRAWRGVRRSIASNSQKKKIVGIVNGIEKEVFNQPLILSCRLLMIYLPGEKNNKQRKFNRRIFPSSGGPFSAGDFFCLPAGRTKRDRPFIT
jgi:hypothetical protein